MTFINCLTDESAQKKRAAFNKMTSLFLFMQYFVFCFISVGKTPASCKRWVNQYPACLSGGSYIYSDTCFTLGLSPEIFKFDRIDVGQIFGGRYSESP